MAKKTTKKKVAKKTTKSSDQYVASAKIMGKNYEGKGETIYEAIGNIRPGGIGGMVIMTVTHGKKSKERILPLMAARRLFKTVGLTREVALKNTSLQFDGI